MALDANILGGVSGNRAEVEALNSTLRVTQPQRRVSGTLAAANAEVVLALNGESSATLSINGTGTFNATYAIQGSPDGTNYFDLVGYSVPQFSVPVAGAPLAGTPLISEAVSATVVQRLLSIACGGLQSIRVRLTTYTSGTATAFLSADIGDSLSPYVRDNKASTLVVTATAAVSVAVTATLPAAVGLRHYVDRIDVTRFVSGATTLAATPVLVTTTNIPGAPILSFPAEANAAGTGLVSQQSLDPGGQGLAATAVGTATTVVCPATTGIIWRINVIYRLGQ